MQLPSTFIDHAIACFPNEACGLICKGEFIACENLSETPGHAFKIDPAIVASRDDIDYIVHSHTINFGENSRIDPRTPSEADMQGQIDTDLPWAIAYCDGQTVTAAQTFGDHARPPFEGREFVLNVSDCLTLVTDYFAAEFHIHLPAIPRSIAWVARGEDLITENFTRFGFTQVSPADAKPGDVVLFKLPRSGVPDHLGVYLGDNRLLHLLAGRLSCIEELSTYVKFLHSVVRHKELA